MATGMLTKSRGPFILKLGLSVLGGREQDMARVLYIEDNQANRLLVLRVLTAEGHTVLEAENGLMGLQVAQRERPDLVLVDISMPEMDGYEVTSRLRALSELERVPIVALTANVLRGDRERSLQAGCDGYIQKPLDVDLLPSQVEAFLRAAAS
jgi:two-component system cell cycle response regulator DivK